MFPIFGTLAFAAGGFSPLGVGAWRIGAAALTLGGISLAVYGRGSMPRRCDLPRLFLCALLGVVINQGLFLLGLARSTPMNAGLVMSLIPVFTFAIAAGVGQEAFSLGRGAGIGVAFVGAALLLLGQGSGLDSGHGLGNALMVLNALSYSSYLVLSRPLLERYRSLSVIAWIYILSLPVLPLFMIGQKLLPDAGAHTAWWSLVYILVFPTVIAYLLNMFALARLRASTTAVYIYLQPLITGVAAWMVFGELPTRGMGGAALLLFLGIWLVARKPASAIGNYA